MAYSTALKYTDDYDLLYDDELNEDPADRREEGGADAVPLKTGGQEEEREEDRNSGNASAHISPYDAFVYSINRSGSIDLPYMASLTGLTCAELVRKLEGRVMWRNPTAFNPDEPYEGWLTREMYVRGNIYRLIEEAEEAQEKTGLFGENLRLLRSVVPEGPEEDQISVTLGATWVPEDVYLDFISELLDMEDYPPSVRYDPFFGKWHIRRGYSFNDALNERIYGTKRMHAKAIIEHTMNASPIRVSDKTWDPEKGKDVYVLNRRETMAAQEKQRQILEAFRKWLGENPDVMERLQEIYTDRYGYQITHFDGSFLELPGMNPDVQLYAHQRNAIARIVLSPENVLLSHSVGTGKTYEFEAGIFERVRMGLSKKALIVVPNAVLDATVKSFQYLYPFFRVHAYYPSDFGPAKRENVLREIEDTPSGVFIMAYSSYDMIAMSKKWQIDEMEREIRRVSARIPAAPDYATAHELRRYRDKIRKKLQEFETDHIEAPTECFDRLGIDLLVVDECQNYKNISLHYNMDPIVGMHSKGSRKADSMLKKSDCVRERGGKLIFATGTPLTNSLADLFVLQRYLQPKELELLGIGHFNEWVNTFCSKKTDFEIDVSASSFKFVTRFDRFHNLPELMALFGNVCDFYTVDTDDLDLPDFSGYENVRVARSPEQALYIRKIADRTEQIRRGMVSRKDDNYLRVTTDGRKCALDIRLVDPEGKLKKKAAKVPKGAAAGGAKSSKEADVGAKSSKAASGGTKSSKVEAAAENILRIYREYPGTTQVVFCDISTPKDGFNVYDDLKKHLVSGGIPKAEVRFIHEGTTEAGRAKILEAFNRGTIRVLMGSTQKLGIGVNIQENLIAVHHLDAPWKPSDMVQREGRAIRQGNANAEVFIYRYVTDGSFDAYTWQILENKQKFIASFLSGTMDRLHRSEEDIGDLVLDYSEIKALAIGNPLIRTRVELANSITRERAKSFDRQEELRSFERVLAGTAPKAAAVEKKIREITTDIRTYRNRKAKMSSRSKIEYGEKLLDAVAKHMFVGKDKPYGWYRGFRVILPAGLRLDVDHPYIILRGCGDLQYRVNMKEAKPAGVPVRMDNVLDGLAEEKRRFDAEYEGLKRQYEDAEEQIAIGNPCEKTIEKLQKQLDDVDRRLREAAG